MMMTAEESWLFPELEPKPEAEFHAPPARDWMFPADNALEIPTLRLDRMAMAMHAPVACWGSIPRRDTRNVRSWHFYADDYRFEQLRKTPGDVVATGAQVCVEPNFSVLDDMPWPVGWYNLYRKRWVARWWQDQGIEIVADLFVGAPWIDTARGNHAGLIGTQPNDATEG